MESNIFALIVHSLRKDTDDQCVMCDHLQAVLLNTRHFGLLAVDSGFFLTSAITKSTDQ